MGRFPFPHHRRNSALTYPTQADTADVARALARFRAEIVTSEGACGYLRTRRPDTPDGVANSTVSEGIAYGMMISVMVDDQPSFDGFWHYARHFANECGLMSWYIAPDGSRVLGSGAATDADEDIAYALVLGHRQWGGPESTRYLDAARRQIERIWEFEVDHGEFADMLLPGDEWRGRNVFNPSYFAPNQYRLFGEVSGNVAEWGRVVERGYDVVFRSLNEANGNLYNGLVPAWCDAGGTPVEAFPGALTNYQYDSARMPFRLAQDFADSGEPRARDLLARMSDFFASTGAMQIVDGYTLRGEPAPDPRTRQPNPGSAVFVGSAAVGAMHDPRYQSFIDAAYARLRTGELLARSSYYNQCWTVISLLMLTGNFWSFEEE